VLRSLLTNETQVLARLTMDGMQGREVSVYVLEFVCEPTYVSLVSNSNAQGKLWVVRPLMKQEPHG